MTDPFTAAPEPSKRGGRPASNVERDRWDRPLLPAIPAGDPYGPTDPTTKAPHTSVSTLADVLVDWYGLNKWKRARVALGLAARHDIFHLVCSLDLSDPEDPDYKNRMKDLYRYVEDAMEAAGSSVGRNNGTALHAFTDRMNQGKPAGNVPRALAADIDAYRAGLAEHNFETMPECCEKMIVTYVGDHKVAGTIDTIVSCPDWPLPRIGDTKSAQDVTVGAMKIAIQLAFYSRGSAIWNPLTKRYEPMPKVDQDTGIIFGLPALGGRFEAWDADLARGWELAKLAVRVHGERKYKGYLTPYERPTVESGPAGEPAAEPPSWADRIATATSQTDLSQVWTEATAAGQWTAELHKLGMARLAEIKQNQSG